MQYENYDYPEHIKIPLDITISDIYKNTQLLYLWIRLLFMAKWPVVHDENGQSVILQENGVVFTTVSALARSLKFTRKAADRHLDFLITTGRIKKEKAYRSWVITIIRQT